VLMKAFINNWHQITKQHWLKLYIDNPKRKAGLAIIIADIWCHIWLVLQNFRWRWYCRFTYKVRLPQIDATVIAAVTSDYKVVKVFYSTYGEGFAEAAAHSMKLEREKYAKEKAERKSHNRSNGKN
jgi:hypothetical protein